MAMSVSGPPWVVSIIPPATKLVDLSAAGTAAHHALATFTAAQASNVTHVLVWWEADLTDGISLSTHPADAGPEAHWRLQARPVPYDPHGRID